MNDKERNEIREYNRGYRDGPCDKKYNDSTDTPTQLLTLGFEGGPREGAKEYSEGYKAGREDRQNKK